MADQSSQRAELPPELGFLLDRQRILDCLTKVCRGMDRFDRALYLSAFHDDALIDAGALVGGPKDAYDKGAELHEHGQISTLHSLLNHSCEIEGDAAHAETYFLFTARNRDETNWAAAGRYLDRLERRDGTWRIAFRLTIVEWSGNIPASSVPLFENVEDLHGNGAPARSREDPSYRRPLVNRRARTRLGDVRALGLPRQGG
jgi:hypothetical protein